MSNQLQLGRPPVEPLSDVAWARVERGLWARMDTGSHPVVTPPSGRRWLWIAAPALACAAIALVIEVRRSAPPVATTDGPLIIRTSEAPSSVAAGDAHITLEAESTVVVSREEPTAMVERGAASFEVAPRHEHQPYVVVAGDTMVRVIGTRFRVARSAEITMVTVERGLIDVRFHGVAVQVGAGQAWSSEHPNDISTSTRTAYEPPPPVRRTPPPVTSPAAPDETEMAPVRARPPAKPVTPPGAKPTAPGPGFDPDEAKFNQLSALERREPATALAGYLELSRGNGRWAANALYAAGRLATDMRDPRATTFLKIYLRRFPKGRNADDARKLLEGDHR